MKLAYNYNQSTIYGYYYLRHLRLNIENVTEINLLLLHCRYRRTENLDSIFFLLLR